MKKSELIGSNGLGDPYNSYAYSAAKFKGELYIGTGRANLVFLKYGMPDVKMKYWPVPVEHKNYSYEFERNISGAEIVRLSRWNKRWTQVYKSEYTEGSNKEIFRKHYGYRSMLTFKENNEDKYLYVASTSRSRGKGPDIMRTKNGTEYQIMQKINASSLDKNTNLTSIRSLHQFEELLITTITGGSKGKVNGAGISIIYATDDPSKNQWKSINGNGFEKYPEVIVVYELCTFNNYLYAATAGINGFQIWKGKRISKYNFDWKKVLDKGAGRGALNQGIISMHVFQDFLYIGTGIQNGGHDRKYKVGPAAAEVLRLDKKDNVDIICGEERNGKKPLSGYGAGFSNYFNAYIWKIQSLDDSRLLVGTMDWSIFGLYTEQKERESLFGRAVNDEVLEEYLKVRGGAELWESKDGIYWHPITLNGFDNKYNFGIRNIIQTTDSEIIVGTANPFGPKVYKKEDGQRKGSYINNKRGGCEAIRITF